MANEQVRFDLKVDIDSAIKQLKKIAETSDNGAEAIQRLSKFLVDMSKRTKVPLEQLRRELELINKELTKKQGRDALGRFTSGNRDIFREFKGGGSEIFSGVKAYNEAAQAAGRFQTTANGVATSTKKVGDAMEGAGKKAQGFRHGIDVVRTALGTLLAVGIFQFLSAISSTFDKLIENLKEAETAFFNLVNAEQRLSEQGIDVTPKGLDNLIKKLQQINPMLSEIQAEELVSSIATKVAPTLGLGQKEIESLSVSIALLTVRNMALGKSFDEVMAQVETGLLSGTVTKGINQLGVKITEQAVKEKAVEMQLIKNADAYDKLNAEQKEHVTALSIIAILEENRNKELQNLPKFLESASAKIGEASALWDNFLTNAGKTFAPVIKAVLEGAIQFLESLNRSLMENGEAWKSVATILVGVVKVVSAVVNTFTDVTLAFGRLNAMIVEFFQKIPLVGEIIKKIFPEDAFPDTPTSNVKEFGEAIEELDTSALEKVRDIFQDTANAVEDLAKKLFQKIADLDTEYKRKAEDAEVDYLRKIEDINRDAERDMARVKERHREQDRRDEEKYQLALWELRMRFLMDLEDALHARDARQVIRLQKQYNLDKEALRRKHELEGRQREEDQRNELEDIERRRQERLEDARLEHEQRLADLNLAKQREQQDLNTWYMREFADLQEAQDRKIKELLAGWAKEQEITEANAAQVYAILRKYFGPGGYTDELYQYMMQSLVASTQNAIAAITPSLANLTAISGTSSGASQIGVSSSTSVVGGSTGGGSGRRSTSGRGRAEGGTLIATRPTKVLFGEAGIEAATFTPLNRIGRNEGKVDLSGSLAGLGANSKIAVDVTLSPDLRASVVEEAMDGVGDVIFRINGTKV